MQNHYGWDKYRKKGIKELKRLYSSEFFANKPAMLDLINRYIKFYETKAEENIMGKTLYPEKDVDTAAKYASKLIKEFRKDLEEFYKTEEGKRGDCRIYFIASKGNYRLGVKPKKDLDEAKKELKKKEISYKEKVLFKTRYSPVLYYIVTLVSLVLVIFLSFIGLKYIFLNPKKMVNLFFVAFIALLWFIVIALLRLPEKKMSFVGIKYFLIIKGKDIILASYSGKCVICGGKVELSSSSHNKGQGYIGKCNINPDNHTYTFDYTTLKGEFL